MSVNPDFLNLTELPGEALRLLEESDALAAPVDLEKICSMNDWPLTFEELENSRAAATTLLDGESVRIVVNTAGSDNAIGFASNDTLKRRQRFSLAHEIAHAWLNSHRDYELQKKLTTADNPHAGRYKLMRENQANEFASNLLLPYPLLEPHFKQFAWDNVINECSAICDAFEVSLTVALRRMTVLAPFPAVMLFFDESGRSHQRAAVSKYFSDTGLRIPDGAQLPPGSLVARLAGDPLSRVSTMRNLNAQIWFPDSRNLNKFKLQEWSSRIGAHGFLSFIAIGEDEDYSDNGKHGGDDDDWGY